MPRDGTYIDPEVIEHNRILSEMERVLDERGWCKHTQENTEGEVCLAGALSVVLYGATFGEPLRSIPMWKHLCKTVGVQNAALEFNNCSTTTYADIKRVLREARR